MLKRRFILLPLLLLITATQVSAYTVYLKDGAKLIAKEPPEIRGDQAIIILQSGTQTSIAASEIDVERTRRANQYELGTALILEGGEFTETPATAEPEKERRLSDLMRDRNGSSGRRSPATQSRSSQRREAIAPAVDLLEFERRPYRNLDAAGEIQSVFRGQGVGQTRLFQGTSQNRVLIDLTTDSEAAVFRGLKVAATALVHLQTRFPGKVDAFELVLSTSNRSRAGQFLLDTEVAARLADGDLEPSTYYVEYVRF